MDQGSDPQRLGFVIVDVFQAHFVTVQISTGTALEASNAGKRDRVVVVAFQLRQLYVDLIVGHPIGRSSSVKPRADPEELTRPPVIHAGARMLGPGNAGVLLLSLQVPLGGPGRQDQLGRLPQIPSVLHQLRIQPRNRPPLKVELWPAGNVG